MSTTNAVAPTPGNANAESRRSRRSPGNLDATRSANRRMSHNSVRGSAFPAVRRVADHQAMRGKRIEGRRRSVVRQSPQGAEGRSMLLRPSRKASQNQSRPEGAEEGRVADDSPCP